MYGSNFADYTDRVISDVPNTGPSCQDNCIQIQPAVVGTTSMDVNGKEVPPVVAAKRLAELLADTRTINIPGDQKGSGNKRDLLGELVSVNFELAGFRDKPIFLKWWIFQKGSQSHLFGKWVDNFVAYRLEATTDDDTGALQMWIPLPKVLGPYILDLSLTGGGASLASADSDPFD
jgi:hypothetical protein